MEFLKIRKKIEKKVCQVRESNRESELYCAVNFEKKGNNEQKWLTPNQFK